MKRSIDGILQEDGDEASFYKILHGRDLCSEHLRRIPKDFLRSVYDDFTYRVVLKVAWGSSWSIPLSRIRGCIFMETCGWEEFLSDNLLGDDEFLVFTHEGRMRLNVKIFSKDGVKIIQPREFVTTQAARRNTPGDAKGKPIFKGVKKEEPELEMSDLVELHGGGKPKPETGLQHKKADAPKKRITTKKAFNVHRAPESSSSSQLPRFTIEIKKAYLTFLMIPKWFATKHLPSESMTMLIHHPTGKTWKVAYLYRETRMTLSAGWLRVVREMGIQAGDWCTLELFKDNVMRIHVSKTRTT